jgi:hypothetical protein
MNQTPGSTPRATGDAVELQGHYGSRSRSRRDTSDHGKSAFVPLLILLAGMVAWSAFQLVQLRSEATLLEATRSGQEQPLQQAQRVRQALDTLATETRKLAEGGNANAKLILEELRKRGVTVSPPPQPRN